MSTAVADPLHALSLARTALSDPAALPPKSDIDPDLSMAAEFAEPARVAYAIAQIDNAIGGLCFEPFGGSTHGAELALANLEWLITTMAEDLGERAGFEGPVAKIRAAAEHLAGASVLLASTGLMRGAVDGERGWRSFSVAGQSCGY